MSARLVSILVGACLVWVALPVGAQDDSTLIQKRQELREMGYAFVFEPHKALCDFINRDAPGGPVTEARQGRTARRIIAAEAQRADGERGIPSGALPIDETTDEGPR